jgi:hypothetical protein
MGGVIDQRPYRAIGRAKSLGWTTPTGQQRRGGVVVKGVQVQSSRLRRGACPLSASRFAALRSGPLYLCDRLLFGEKPSITCSRTSICERSRSMWPSSLRFMVHIANACLMPWTTGAFGLDCEDVDKQLGLTRGEEFILDALPRSKSSRERPSSRLCDFLRNQQSEIVADWTNRMHAVSPTRGLSNSAIVDHLPRILSRMADLDVFLTNLLRAMLDNTESVDTAVMLLREGDTLRVRAAVGLEEGLNETFSIAPPQGIAGHVAAARQPIFIRDAMTDDRIVSRAIREGKVHALYAAWRHCDGSQPAGDEGG